MIEESNRARTIPLLPDWDSPGGDGAHGDASVGWDPADGGCLRAILAGIDLSAVAVVWLTAVALAPRTDPAMLAAGTAATVATLVGLRAAGLYQARVCALQSRETVRVAVASLFGAGVFAAVGRALGEQITVPVLLVALSTAAAVLAMRWCFARWLKARHSAGRSLRTVVLVGTNRDAVDLWTTLTSEPELGYRVGAVVGPGRPDAPWRHLPGSENFADVAILASKVGANGVILVGSALGDDGRSALAEAFEAGLHVQMSAGVPVDSRRLQMTPTLGVPLLYVEPGRSPSATLWARRAKRTVDVFGALLVGVATAPLLAAAAALIKLEDGGPVLYRAERVGQFGVPITVFKLRTMVPGASRLLSEVAQLNERTDGPLFKAQHDPRVTRVGRFLRASSIDELPQLWNVLNGTMSLVGPRPALPSEVERFDPELRRRHQVRPGITGPWQLEARDNPSFNAYRRYDLAYVDSWSLGWDISILCGTARAVVARGLRSLLQPLVGRRRRRSAVAVQEERPAQGTPSVDDVVGERGRGRPHTDGMDRPVEAAAHQQ